MSLSEKNKIQKHFDAKAVCYESSAVLQRTVCDELLQRLDLMSLQPSVILDVGCGTGWGTEYLLKKYKKAKIFSLDLSPEMLKQTKSKGGWIRKPHLICADAEDIPLDDASVDLVFSSLMLQWCDYKKVFAEFKRVLKPEGLLMFSTFGPDTLKELKQSWLQVDDFVHVNTFTDMHDLGDGLIQVGLAEPVMDMDLLTLTYKDVVSVMTDLKSIGANTLLKNQKNKSGQGLMTPAKLKKVIAHYEGYRKEGVIPASYEVVYGHAWKTPQRATKISQANTPPTEFSIATDQIKK
ncbi:Malonyl-[acyl-carrier protein] O-methyltransferase [hydrothermal vent metagenome]|uniref:malonyl-[acyl-carrier protein] O-methyltransferase n=1 Tax=hydrothermal vent metagenome TaxID=652676 RepID=A0A3B0WF18_9ZZZZ